MPDPLNVPKAVRRLLYRRGLTITAAARLAGIERSHLSRALGGKAELSSRQWRRLYAALGVGERIRRCVVAELDRA